VLPLSREHGVQRVDAGRLDHEAEAAPLGHAAQELLDRLEPSRRRADGDDGGPNWLPHRWTR
jgi:hypothetical protein